MPHPGEILPAFSDAFKKLTDKLNKISKRIPLLDFEVSASVSGGRVQSYDCCPDCTIEKPTEDGFVKNTYDATATANASVTVGLPQTAKDDIRVKKAYEVFGKWYRVIVDLSTPNITAAAKLSGSGAASIVQECPNNDCGAAEADLEIDIIGKAGAGFIAGYQEFVPGNSGCTVSDPLLAVKIDACWVGGRTLSASGFSIIDADALKAEGAVTFPLLGQTCANEDISCFANFGKVDFSTEYNFTLSFMGDLVEPRTAGPFSITEGYTGQCE